MNYNTWVMVQEECWNDEQVSFQRMSRAAQAALKEAHAAGARIESLERAGSWTFACQPSWHPGLPYRVSPAWPGPAKPEPAVEYEDKNVFLVGAAYRFFHPSEDATRWLLAAAPGTVGFVGYVMWDGKLEPCLIFDQQPDGTYRPRIPKAVRFLKGAV
jgi:hypothetical protein